MSGFLRDLLDAEEPLFSEAVHELEAASGKRGTDAKLVGDITEKAHESIRALGLDPLHATGEEIYHALDGRVEADIARVTATIGAKPNDDVRALIPHMIKAAEGVEFNRRVFVLKHDSAKDLLRKMPPKKLMEHLGYSDVEAMFAGEDFDELYTALRFSEGADWLNKYDELFKTVTADDYEERDIRILAMNHDKYVDLAVGFVQKKLHNITHTKEMGTIVVVPMHQRRMRGLVLKSLPLLLHYMNEIKLYSTFFKMKSHQPHFGKIVVQTLIADPGDAASVAGHYVHWRVIQRYLGKHRDATVDPAEWEPHVQPEDLHWRRAEDLLFQIEPALEFWKDRDYVGLMYDDFPISFNLFDVSFAYSNSEVYKNRYAYHFRESLWNELFSRYMGERNLEQQVLKQLDNDMIAPEKLPVAASRSGRKYTIDEERALSLRKHLIDSAEGRLDTAVDEFANVFALLKTFEKTVTVFGTARELSDSWATDTAYAIAHKLAEDGYAVITGGGQGVMAAANHGAYDAGGNSIGLNILLPKEQHLNTYTTASFQFQHFFSRKVSMTLYDSAYIYLPGGFGTLDELFEILVLVQTGKIPKVPVVLVGSLFWKPLHEFFRTILLDNKTIDASDTHLYHIVDSVDEAVRIVEDYQQ